MDATRAAAMPECECHFDMGAGETRSTTRDKEMIQWKVRKWIRCWIPFNLMCFSLNFFSFCCTVLSPPRNWSQFNDCYLALSNFSSLKSNYLTIAFVCEWTQWTALCGCASDAHIIFTLTFHKWRPAVRLQKWNF